MSDSQSDIKTLYNEGCSALRHYSLCVLNSATIVIVQGFVILSGSLYLLNAGNYWLSLSTAVFGFFFTAVIFMIEKNYWLHFDAVLESVVALEKQLNSDDVEGPWTVSKRIHGTGRNNGSYC